MDSNLEHLYVSLPDYKIIKNYSVGDLKEELGSVKSYNIWLVKDEVLEKDITIQKLSEVLKLDEEKIHNIYNNEEKCSFIKKNVKKNVMNSIRELKLEGVYCDISPKQFLSPDSKFYQSAIYICQLISINKKEFTEQAFSDYKEGKPSLFMMGNTHVTNGAVQILTAASIAGLFPSESKEETVSFYFKTILDSLDDSETLDKLLGAYLRTFITRSLMKQHQKSGFVSASERLKTRFKEVLNEDQFVFDKEFFGIKDKSVCEDIYNSEMYAELGNNPNEEMVCRKVVNSIPLWFGTDSIIKTKEIKQMLIDISCLREITNFIVLFDEVTKRALDWLVNSPISFESYGGAESDTKNINFSEKQISLDERLKVRNPFDNSLELIFLEQEIKLLTEEFTVEEILILRQTFNGRIAREISPLIGVGTSATATKIKSVHLKLAKGLNKIKDNLKNKFDEQELFLAFKTELEYIRV